MADRLGNIGVVSAASLYKRVIFVGSLCRQVLVHTSASKSEITKFSIKRQINLATPTRMRHNARVSITYGCFPHLSTEHSGSRVQQRRTPGAVPAFTRRPKRSKHGDCLPGIHPGCQQGSGSFQRRCAAGFP